MANENENLENENAAANPATPSEPAASASPAATDKEAAAKATSDPIVKLTRKGVTVFRKKSEIGPLLEVGWKIAER